MTLSAHSSAAPGEHAEVQAPSAGPSVVDWVVLVLTVFVLGRSPVLFLRQRLVDVVGGPIGPIWQDDPLIRAAFLLSTVSVSVLVVRRGVARHIASHGVLLALLAMAGASSMWSVEPSVTQLRALMFLTTAGVGWYLGSRFNLRQQLDVVIAAGTIGLTASLVALRVWPDLAKRTNGVLGEWSGVYVNRNLLALALSTTLLAVALRWPSARNGQRVVFVSIALPALWLLRHSGGRTGPVSVAAALAAVVLAALVRSAFVRRGASTLLSAGITLAGAAIGLLVAIRAHGAVLKLLGREPTLTRRTDMWEIDRSLIAMRPWRGWGFEAIWSHQPAIDYAAPRFHAYPYQAHNGYFEMSLSLGRIGLFLLLGLIVVTLVRCVALAWEHPGAEAFWPLAIATFAVVANLSESMFIANEALWALFVSAGVAAVSVRRRREPGTSPEQVDAGSPGSR